MTTNSWDALRLKLAPNPRQHKAWPIMLVATAYTTGGVVLMFGSLVLLFGITGVPTSFADLSKESTWRLVLDIAGLYTMWMAISNGNNFFGVHRPTGYISCLSGAVGLVVVARDLVVSSAVHLQIAAAVLRDLLTAAMILGSLLAGALLLRAGNVWFARAQRYFAKVVRDPGDLRGLGYSLYLRTFSQDDALSNAQSFSLPKRALRGLFVVELTEEELVAEALSDGVVPMVGVGRPGEPAPHLGALRVYLPQADWKPQVRELIEGARHVVLTLGWGEGTLWELSEAMRILAPEQLILVVAMEQPEYERFQQETTKSLPAGLPAYAGRREIRSPVCGLITFSEGWKATFVPVRAYSPFHNSLRIALTFAAWPALRRLGYPPRGVLRWAPGRQELSTTHKLSPSSATPSRDSKYDNFGFYKLGLFILSLSLGLAWLAIPALGWHTTVPAYEMAQFCVYAVIIGALTRREGFGFLPRLAVLGIFIAAFIICMVVRSAVFAFSGPLAPIPAPVIPVLVGFAFAAGLGMSTLEESLNLSLIGVPIGVFLGRLPLHWGVLNYTENFLLNLGAGIGALLILTKGSTKGSVGHLGFILGFVGVGTAMGWDIEIIDKTFILTLEYLTLYMTYEVLALRRLRAPLH